MTKNTTNDMGAKDRPLAAKIATLMRFGTILAGSQLLAGAVFANLLPDLAVTVLLAGGCGLLVLLPALRLVLMAGHFARLAEASYVVITLTVLALVIAGGVAGMAL